MRRKPVPPSPVPPSPVSSAGRLLALASTAVLMLSILGLAVAFLFGMAEARRDFRRAAISREQLAEVAQIEAALGAGDRTAAARLLARYRALVIREAALVGHPSERATQAAEVARADRLAALAASPATAGRAAVRRLVATISAGEHAEAEEVARHLGRVGTRLVLLAGLLTATALLSAALGAWGLAAANRRLAGQVAARTAELAAAERSRRLFFAKVSHELRTPVTVMRGEAEVALAAPGGGAAPLSDALGRVVAHAEFLDHRIGELLSLARAEHGEPELDHAPLDFAEVVRDAGLSAAAYARALDVGLDVRALDRPAPIRGDARWLGQALVAILDNAVKFSPAERTVAAQASSDGRTVRFTVRDEGAGVAPPELPRIFDAFHQAEAGRLRGGSGLGLALARWVVERHGGTIGAANDPAGGCVVTVVLPLAA